MSGGIGGTRRFLGLSEPTWRILATGAVTAIWMLVAWTATAYANDCAAYVNNPKNFTGNLQGLIEDCMRTGYVQAIATLLIGGIGGGVIAIGVGKTLKDADKNWKEPAPEPEPVTDEDPGPELKLGNCPICGGGPIILARGRCPFCKTTFEPPPEPEPPTPTDEDPGPELKLGNCPICGGGPIILARGRCPFCKGTFEPASEPEPPAAAGEAPSPEPKLGNCPNCGGGPIILARGRCPFCKTTFEPPAEQPACPRCGGEMPVGGTADGRCPTCGAKQPTSTETTGTSTKLPEDGSSPPVTLTGDPSSPTTPVIITQSAGGTPPSGTPATGATAPAGGTTPDPPFTQEGVISGDKAAELLEQAGLGKITRDANGKVINVEEAFPGAFTSLGGQTVTIKGGETTGGGLGQDFVELSKGKVTGIGVGPNGEVAIVVNHSEPKWEPRPATPAEIAAKFIQDAQAAAARASQAVTDAAKSAEKAYNDLKKKMDQADLARAAYKFAKFTENAVEAEKQIRDLAKQNGVDPDELVYIVKLDNLIWDGIKAGVKLPDSLRGK